MSGGDRRRLIMTLALVVGCPLGWSVLAYLRFGAQDTIYTAWRGGAAIPALAAPEWWRVFTAPLLHVDPLHLGVNLVLLAAVVVMARRVSRFPVLVVIALSAWTATAVGVFTRPGWALGASAAFYGLVGGLAGSAMRDRARRKLAAQVSAVAFVAIALGPGDRPAHLVGLVTGAVFAHLPTTGAAARATRLVVGVLLVVGAAFGLSHGDGTPTEWRPVATSGTRLQVPAHWVAAPAVGPCAWVYTDGLRAACALAGPEAAGLEAALSDQGYRARDEVEPGGWPTRVWDRVVGTGVAFAARAPKGEYVILLTVGSPRGRAPWMEAARFAAPPP